MLSLWLVILLSSFFCFGWHSATAYEPMDVVLDVNGDVTNPYGTAAKNREIAWWFRFYIGNFICKHVKFLKPLLKPLFMCVVCMPSIYATLIYIFFTQFSMSFTYFISCLFVIICTSGLNRIIKVAIQK